VRRTGQRRSTLLRLAKADVFASIGLNRRTALWQVLSVHDDLPLFAAIEEDGTPPRLSPMALRDQMTADYMTTGLSLKAHPMSLVRDELDRLGVITAKALATMPNKEEVRVAGIVLVRQSPPTAKGTVFLTLEDETASVNLVVWASVWERYRKKARSATALYARGRIERAGNAVHVIVGKLADLSDMLCGIATRARDFR
jgi:error-prone DNA polymerase